MDHFGLLSKSQYLQSHFSTKCHVFQLFHNRLSKYITEGINPTSLNLRREAYCLHKLTRVRSKSPKTNVYVRVMFTFAIEIPVTTFLISSSKPISLLSVSLQTGEQCVQCDRQIFIPLNTNKSITFSVLVTFTQRSMLIDYAMNFFLVK